MYLFRLGPDAVHLVGGEHVGGVLVPVMGVAWEIDAVGEAFLINCLLPPRAVGGAFFASHGVRSLMKG